MRGKERGARGERIREGIKVGKRVAERKWEDRKRRKRIMRESV